MTAKVMKLDWLAQVVVEVLGERLGAAYAEEVAERLAGENRFGVVLWLNDLDQDNLYALAERLGVDPVDLDITRRTAQRL